MDVGDMVCYGGASLVRGGGQGRIGVSEIWYREDRIEALATRRHWRAESWYCRYVDRILVVVVGERIDEVDKNAQWLTYRLKAALR